MAPPGILKGKKALLSGAEQRTGGRKKEGHVCFMSHFPLADYMSLSISWEAVLCCFSVLLKYKIRHSISSYHE